MTGRRLSSAAWAVRISSNVMGGGSGVAAIACTRNTVSQSDELGVGEAGTTGLADPSTRSIASLDRGESRRLDDVGISTVGASEVNHWGKS